MSQGFFAFQNSSYQQIKDVRRTLWCRYLFREILHWILRSKARFTFEGLIGDRKAAAVEILCLGTYPQEGQQSNHANN